MTIAVPMPSRSRRIAINVMVMATVVMQILDTTIVNVALPHMQASLGAAPDTISWVLTSYIVATAIVIPITGWLEARIGRRNLFVIAAAGFTVASAMCGMAQSLEFMVLARTLQGVLGAFVAPLAQATMLDGAPPEKQPQAMMIFSMGTMVAPILGPIFGGWLTDTWGWRWCFFVNLPIGIVATIGLWFTLLEVPQVRRKMDLSGFILLGIAVGVLQLMLDRGSHRDWFDSTEIVIECGIGIAALWMFVVHSMTTRQPLIPRAVIRDRNFVLSTIFTMLISGVAISGPALVAPMLQTLMGYDAGGAGLAMAPRGVGALIAMPLAARLIGKVDSRILIAFGVSCVAGSLWMMSSIDLGIGSRSLLVPHVIQGLGLGFCFLPLNILAFSTLPGPMRTEGAAIYNLTRNMAGSLSISAFATVLSRSTQMSHSDLGSHITADTLPMFSAGHAEALGPAGMIPMMIDGEINRQAAMIGYLNDFYLMMWIALATLPFLVLLRRPSAPPGTPQVMME